MSEDRYFKEIGYELLKRGIWGSRARWISEQLADHYHEGVRKRAELGEDPASAAKKTIEALGAPAVIAEAAAVELRLESRLVRHPWLLAGGGMFMSIIAVWAMLLLGVINAGFHLAATEQTKTWVMGCGASLLNWLPFAAGCVFLGLWARRSGGSWKVLIIASVALGLSTSAIFAMCIPPMHGPGSGLFLINADGVLGAVLELASFTSKTLARTLRFPFGYRDFVHMTSLVRLLLPVSSVICARQWLSKVKAAEVASAN